MTDHAVAEMPDARLVHRTRDMNGMPLTPGVNVDRVDVAAGVQRASEIGYSDAVAQMIVEYALMRHRRGEEEGAQRTWLSYFPRDLTSWTIILAHAIESADAAAVAAAPQPVAAGV